MSSKLFSPLVLPCGGQVPNRILKSAMSEAMGTPDGAATPNLARLYKTWAKGGTGLLVTGNVMIDARALGEPGNVVIEDERHLDSLKRWASAARDEGAEIWMQLNHPGRQCPKFLNKESVAPSAVPFRAAMRPYFPTPRALTPTEIADIVARFGRAAAVAQKAGFSGVQIHGAHGYLVSQFLAPRTNQRDDAYGGDAERRRQFALEVYRSIRSAVGPSFPVSIKINCGDFDEQGGLDPAEATQAMLALASEGMDLIEISGGTYERPAMATARGIERQQDDEPYFLQFARQIRSQIRTPLALTGGFRTAKSMHEVIDSSVVDMVGVARTLAVDPDMPATLRQDPTYRSPVRKMTTGIKMLDRTAMLEVTYYELQLARMGKGQSARADLDPRLAVLQVMMSGGARMFKRRRASS